MSAIVAALLAELDDQALDHLADLLAPRIANRNMTNAASPTWMNVEQTAEHLNCPKSRVYALVSARRIPFVKEGSRTLFDRCELDVWVRSGGGKRP